MSRKSREYFTKRVLLSRRLIGKPEESVDNLESKTEAEGGSTLKGLVKSAGVECDGKKKVLGSGSPS